MSDMTDFWFSPPYGEHCIITASWRAMGLFAGELIEDGKAGAIIGAPGLGKSMMLRQFAFRDAPFGCLIEVSKNGGRMRNILALIAQGTKIDTGLGNGFDIERELLANLPGFVERGGYLMIDEAGRLDDDALQAVLDLNDKTHLPIVLAGNADILKRKKASEAAFRQVTSRLRRLPLIEGAPRLDLDALAVDRNVDGKDAFRLLYYFARGGRKGYDLRLACDVMDGARKNVGLKGPIRRHHLEDAVERHYGEHVLARFIKSDNQEENEDAIPSERTFTPAG